MTTNDEVEAVALLACPFCGGDATRFTIGADEPDNEGGDCIGCTRCHCSTSVEFGRKENLVSRWNTRAAMPNATRLGELETEIHRLTDALHFAHSEGFEWPVDPLPFGCIAWHLRIERGNTRIADEAAS